MKKRIADTKDDSPHLKRHKLTQALATDKVSNENGSQIRSAQDLQSLLAFSQDADPQHLKQNIKNFKTFLDSITFGEDENDRSAKLKILLHYVRLQKPHKDDDSSKCLASVVQSWSFATQSNNEGLFSAIAVVLGLFLKVTSSHVDFREHGNNLCNTLLQEGQIKLFSRALNTNKPKDHVLSPCLRLLTEIVTYDGGAAAKNLYSYWDVIFKRLETFLTMRNTSITKISDGQLRPSIRTNALRFLFANLRLQDRITKTAILSQARVFRAVFQDIEADPPTVISEILNALKTEVLSDQNVSQITKNRLFTDWTLNRIASLYGFHGYGNSSEHESINVQELAHSFLLHLCTTVDHGILIAPHEFQSQGGIDVEEESSPVDLSAQVAAQKSRKARPIKNTVLASFLQGLRPYANVLQSELSVAIFRAAPELLADYFLKKKSFSFEPKLTATWIGYSMFLLSTILLPAYEGHFIGSDQRRPIPLPPVHLIIESILPQPLTQKNLTRCLNQSINLITFLVIRILIAALRKLTKSLELLRIGGQIDTANNSDLWRKTHSELIIEFCKRCPNVKYVITVFRRCPKDSHLMKEAITHLLAMYYKVLPQSTLEEKFDISLAISGALQDDQESKEASSKGLNFYALYINNLLEIAQLSPNMRWWHKSGTTNLSLFTTLLRLHVCNHNSYQGEYVRALLNSAIEGTPVSKPEASFSSLRVLILTLHDSQGWLASDSVFEFLDNCLLRLIKRPVKYYDDFTDLASTIKSDVMRVEDYEIDLLLITIIEQWSFLVLSALPSTIENAVKWLSRYLDLSMHTGGHMILLLRIRDHIKNLTIDGESRLKLSKALGQPACYATSDELKGFVEPHRQTINDKPVTYASLNTPTFNEDWLVVGPPIEDEDHPALRNWIRKDVAGAIREGDIGELILYLCSDQQDIRIQALMSLKKFMSSLKVSDYTEWRQTYVLMGEIIEVVQDNISRISLPYFAGVMAARFIMILDDPLHFMYAKINKFLNKAPCWDLTRMPSYWVDKILLQPPTDDDAYYQEVEWFQEALVDGLRTPRDMEIYRRCHIFERLLSMLTTSSMPNIHTKKAIDLLYRCTFVGGSTTLITRCSILSWISLLLKAGKPIISNVQALKNLALRVYDTSDQNRVDDWSGATVMRLLEDRR